MYQRLIMIGVTATAMMLGCSSFAGSSSQLATAKSQYSYAMGVLTGRAYIKQKVDVSVSDYVTGFQDALSGKTPSMTEQAMKDAIKSFAAEQKTKRRKAMQQQGEANQQVGSAYLEKNKTQAGVVTTASGLQYKVIEAGTGESPAASDKVTVDYEGKLVDGTVFDSSYKRGKPVTFPVNGVIKGWQEALQLMQPGATWEVTIPGDLAYGKMGMPGSPIGPNATLIFKIHLISVEK